MCKSTFTRAPPELLNIIGINITRSSINAVRCPKISIWDNHIPATLKPNNRSTLGIAQLKALAGCSWVPLAHRPHVSLPTSMVATNKSMVINHMTLPSFIIGLLGSLPKGNSRLRSLGCRAIEKVVHGAPTCR